MKMHMQVYIYVYYKYLLQMHILVELLEFTYLQR